MGYKLGIFHWFAWATSGGCSCYYYYDYCHYIDINIIIIIVILLLCTSQQYRPGPRLVQSKCFFRLSLHLATGLSWNPPWWGYGGFHNEGPPQWMIYGGKSHENGWELGVPLFQETFFFISDQMRCAHHCHITLSDTNGMNMGHTMGYTVHWTEAGKIGGEFSRSWTY